MQLDLLSWSPPGVQIIPFPAKNRLGLIRRTSGNLFHSRTKREADAFWRRSVEGLNRQMTKAGVPADRITAELTAFRDAVQAEIHRLERASERMPDGGAA